MAAIEELINTVITFAFVLLPLWILMSRRRRMQQERRQRSEAPPGQPRPERQRHPQEPQRPPQMPETSGDDYRDRTVDDQSYDTEQRQRSSPREVADSPRSKEPGRLEKMLRDLLGAGESQPEPSAERERQLALARRRAEEAREKRRKVSADRPAVEVPKHADVRIRAVMPESGSLSLSPGGMGSQQMRTAAGNLGASSSAEKTPPAVGSLGEGWRRANRLPDFKRALILSELLGKPHALKDDT